MTLGVAVMKTYSEFEAAEADKADGLTVCGVILKSGDPAYFLMREDTPDEIMQETAFDIRHGRPMSSYERFLLDTAKKLHHAEAVA